jgi:hypothetical protein
MATVLFCNANSAYTLRAASREREMREIQIRRAAYILRAMIERKLETRFSFRTLAIVLHFLLVRHLYSSQAFLFSDLVCGGGEIPKVLDELCHLSLSLHSAAHTLSIHVAPEIEECTRRSMQRENVKKCEKWSLAKPWRIADLRLEGVRCRADDFSAQMATLP